MIRVDGKAYTYDYEVVPDAEKFLHVIARELVLHGLGEECDEIRWTEVATVDTEFVEVKG